MSRIRRLAAGLVALVVCPYALLVVGLFFSQRLIVFPGTRRVTPPVEVPGTTTVPFDGGTVPLLLDEPSAGRPLAVWFHGQGEQLADVQEPDQALTSRGLAFAGVEYPGYGVSTGASASEASLLAAGAALLEVLAERGYPKPVCVGYSLGTGVATAMAAEGLCGRLVLVAPYTSLADLAQERYWYVPARWILLDRLDSLARAPGIDIPVLIFHGTADQVVGVRHGEQLANAFPHARLVLTDRGHVNILTRSTWDGIAAFAKGEPFGE